MGYKSYYYCIFLFLHISLNIKRNTKSGTLRASPSWLPHPHDLSGCKSGRHGSWHSRRGIVHWIIQSSPQLSSQEIKDQQTQKKLATYTARPFSSSPPKKKPYGIGDWPANGRSYRIQKPGNLYVPYTTPETLSRVLMYNQRWLQCRQMTHISPPKSEKVEFGRRWPMRYKWESLRLLYWRTEKLLTHSLCTSSIPNEV